MITTRSIPLPLAGTVRVETAAPPVAVRPSPSSIGELALALEGTQRAEAIEAARREGRDEVLHGACEALQAAAARLDEARERAEEALASDAVALGVEIARQLLKVEIAAENYDLETIVRATLAASEVKRGRCVIHLNPEDAAAIADVAFRGQTEVSPSADVTRGTVHVETPRGLLVRDPEAALEEIREQLLEDLVR
ncbi:MAG: FliH/SctL family protein [Planctomycetota bacterium]